MNTLIIKKGMLAIFASAIMLVSLDAQPRTGCGAGPGQGWSDKNQGGFCIENIIADLTEDQKAALTELRTEHYRQMKDFRNQMGEVKAKERTIMSQHKIDTKAAEKLIDQKTDLTNKQMKVRLAHRAAVKEILTEEQLLQLEQRRGHHFAAQKGQQKGQGMGNNFGPRHRHGRGMNF
ncbi:MAG: Spy/CpxP family protein refolding chaperone [Bacteroidales bacterium]